MGMKARKSEGIRLGIKILFYFSASCTVVLKLSRQDVGNDVA